MRMLRGTRMAQSVECDHTAYESNYTTNDGTRVRGYERMGDERHGARTMGIERAVLSYIRTLVRSYDFVRRLVLVSLPAARCPLPAVFLIALRLALCASRIEGPLPCSPTCWP